MVTKALLFMTNMKYLASDVVSRLETMLETLIPVKTGLQIITGCLKKHIRNWSNTCYIYSIVCELIMLLEQDCSVLKQKLFRELSNEPDQV